MLRRKTLDNDKRLSVEQARGKIAEDMQASERFSSIAEKWKGWDAPEVANRRDRGVSLRYGVSQKLSQHCQANLGEEKGDPTWLFRQPKCPVTQTSKAGSCLP